MQAVSNLSFFSPIGDEKDGSRNFVNAWRMVLGKHPVDSDAPSYLSLLTEEEAEKLYSHSRRIELRPGQVLFKQGELSSFLGFVVSGSLSATSDVPGSEEQLHWTLTVGDTFGEYALIIDGQIGDGQREATLVAQEQCVMETVSFHKYSVFLEDLPHHRCSKLRDLMVQMVTARLYPELSGSLPESQANDLIMHPWRARNPTHNNAQQQDPARRPSAEPSVAGTMRSEDPTQESPKRKDGSKVVVIDDPPVTFLHTDSFLECIWMNKKVDNMISNTTRAIINSEIQVPDTAVFHDGELVAWYFGSCNELKRKTKEKLTSWALIEKICKEGESSSQNPHNIVATLVCGKSGKAMGSENVQYRLLDKRRLETVVSGAKANKLCGVVQKYVRSSMAKQDKDYILQCLWSDHSFSADWVSEPMLECFTQVHKPSRILRTKKLRTQMQVKYHTYVPGKLSIFGDHLKEKRVVNKPIDKRREPKVTTYVTTEDKDDLTGRTVPRQIREVVKVACQQISSIMATHVNGSDFARSTAQRSADAYNSGHNLTFTNVETMCCFFKISKGSGAPVLVNCSAAFGHPDTVERIRDRTRQELLDPKEETFRNFANANAGVSKLGNRAHTMDFTETLRLLIDLELLYKQVSVTEVSQCFEHACRVRNVEDGQLTYHNYCTMMLNLAILLGEAEAPSQLSEGGEGGVVDWSASSAIQGKHLSTKVSRALSGMAVRGAPEEASEEATKAKAGGAQELGGWASFEKQRNLQRTRLGRLFASSIVYARQAEDVEKRAQQREERHLRRTEERARRVKAQLQAEAAAAADRVKRARLKADQTLHDQEESARRRWDKIQDTVANVMAQRRKETEERALAAEERRQERKRQLQEVKRVEERRLLELSKKAALLEEHRREVYAKRMEERENSRLRLSRIGREKEVVSELYQQYARTGALHKPWGLIDLEGDALPAVLEIAADKSRAVKDVDNPKALLLPIVGKNGQRSKSSML